MRIRAEAVKERPGLEGKVFMLLRHTAVCRLAEAGCTTHEISTITGHALASVEQILSRYSVRTKAMVKQAFKRRLSAKNSA